MRLARRNTNRSKTSLLARGLAMGVAITASTALGACAAREAPARDSVTASAPATRGYAPVNGLHMYFEVHGSGGVPLVLLHGGGSTIESSFGAVIEPLARTRRVIAYEQQGHGRTDDVADRPYTFEQSAADALELLRFLHIERADLLGYSNGASIALEVARRRPEAVRKLVLVSGLVRRDALPPGFFDSMRHASPENMPAELREAYLKVAPRPEALATMVSKCARRMLEFKDVPDDAMRAIQSPVLVVLGDADVVAPEHGAFMARSFPHGQLAVLPDTDHMTIPKRADLLLAIVPPFLDAPMPESR